MRRDLVTSAIGVLLITVVFGIAYPLVVTGVSQVLFPGRADGSQIDRAGRVVGSRLIGQDFRRPELGPAGTPRVGKDGRPVLVADPRFFQSRPSTATSYAADATAFTNLGPNSAIARDAFEANLRSYLRLERPFDPGLTASRVPVDAVTSAASGIDPHISPANAAIQAHRVAAVRRLPLAVIDRLIDDNTDGRSLGVLGEPGVNVLDLNLALERGTAR